MTKKGVLTLGVTLIVALLAGLTASCKKEVMVEGGFSVAEGRQVKFATGNLMYDKLQKKFSIASDPTLVVGDVNTEIANPNALVTIDLFGWGTGDDPLRISTNNADYTTYTEWGSKVGGNWRTLTRTEWQYMLKKRPDARKKYAYGSVDNKAGVIILPDIWTMPDSCVFLPGMNHPDSNRYTPSLWRKMSANGAVFLPATGYREGKSYKSASFGRYWSSTEDFANGAWGFAFTNLGEIGVMCYDSRYPGYAVRLVQDVQ